MTELGSVVRMANSSKKFGVLKSVNSVLELFGLQVQPAIYSWRTWETQRRDALRQVKPTLALDVGACVGQWYSKFREDGFDCHVHSFEPDPRAIKIIRPVVDADNGWTLHTFGLAAEPAIRKFHEWPLETGQSSLMDLAEDGPYRHTVNSAAIRQSEIEVRRLDEVFEKRLITDNRVLLKIDVQGSELEVLQGAGLLLPHFAAIEIELALSDFYATDAKIEDVVKFLRSEGFVPLTIQTERWGGNNGTLAGGLDCDVLMVNANLMTHLKDT